LTPDHINPLMKLSGTRGLTPKYRFGRYGPHNKLWFEVREISFSRIESASEEAEATALNTAHIAVMERKIGDWARTAMMREYSGNRAVDAVAVLSFVVDSFRTRC